MESVHVVDLTSLRSSLSTLSLQSDVQTCRAVLAKVLAAKTNGMDLTDMVPKILKLLAHPDLIAKKIVYSILTEYAHKQPDIALLAINTLTQECSNGNPMVRGLALKTVCSLNHENFFEFGQSAVNSALTDSSAYVRRVAVNCCGKLHDRSPNICQESGLTDKLYHIIRDPDPIVAVNAIMTLEEILKEEGGLVVNKNIAHYLLNKLDSLTPWGQMYTMNILVKYKPKSEDETFDIMNMLDKYLSHNSCSVSLACLKLFTHLVEDLPHLKDEVIQRSLTGICSVLTSGNHELVYCVIEILEHFLEKAGSVISAQYKNLFCKYKEPSYLKQKKISLLPLLVTEENGSEILDELCLYTTDSSKTVSLSAITAMGKVIMVQPSTVKHCFTKFKHLIETDVGYILSNTLQVLQRIDMRNMEAFTDLLNLITTKINFLQDDAGRCAFLAILGCYGDKIRDSPYILEDFLEMFGDDNVMSPLVQLHVLTTTVQMFFHHPGICQGMLGEVLETGVTSSDKAVYDQAIFYYTLMATDPNAAKEILI
ncbi:AP-4 complex subunit beta-1-like [Ylistrum balloti]|uniref:AP-4 complex subunit beta-1-like n=1 Tax=Ylistrum balloti TaxID=509963 RepID=UPI002905D1B8|nr:AP-4 complex subunit beta-1-like [Ylistrum balloti]